MGLKVLLDERLRKESGCNSVGLEWKLIHLVGLGQRQLQEKGKSKGKKALEKKELSRGPATQLASPLLTLKISL